ncbi:MAG: hypothetical protein ACJ796_21455 [Gemmatimonadaceae bacterium]
MEQQHPLDNPEFGTSTGDLRENDPSLPGFTESDPLFRSHFQHANRFADKAYEDARPAYQLGFAAAHDARYAGKSFDEAEKDLEKGWLSVRFRGDQWQTVRDYAREGFEQARRIGFVKGSRPSGSDAERRPSYADPLSDNADPTSPGSPESSPPR